MSVAVLPSQSSPSPPRTPNTMPPSRSERLLRDTLRRDELALTAPPVPTRIQHSRRHSTPNKAADDRDHDRDKIAPFLHRSATSAPRPHRHRPPPLAHGDADAAVRYSRPGSPSPVSRRETQDSSHPPLTLTPHGQVLRTRLERVLQAGRGIARAESHERYRSRGHGRDRRKSPPSVSATVSSSDHSEECDDAWLRDVATPNQLSSSPTSLRLHRPNDEGPHCARSHSDPLPLTPPSPTSSGSRSRSHSNSPAHRPSHVHASHLEVQREDQEKRDQSEEPLTPPPTPPPSTPFLTPSRPRFAPSPAHPSTAPQTPFNARTASVQCRQMEGYVSFAAVEGLGEPPDADDVTDTNVMDENKGRILGRIWRALGVEVAGR